MQRQQCSNSFESHFRHAATIHQVSEQRRRGTSVEAEHRSSFLSATQVQRGLVEVFFLCTFCPLETLLLRVSLPLEVRVHNDSSSHFFRSSSGYKCIDHFSLPYTLFRVQSINLISKELTRMIVHYTD